MELQYREKVTALEALIEAANAQRDEQRRIASEIEHKSSKTLETTRSKFQIELNQIQAERDGFESQSRALDERVEDLEREKAQDQRSFENQSNELSDEIQKLNVRLNKSQELANSLRDKANESSALEAQLQTKSL